MHWRATAAAAKSLQSCPTLCDPIDGSPPGSSVPGILQARILEWVDISFSNAGMHAKLLQSCQTLCNPIDGSPPGSSVPGIPQARILEWVAISFSNAWKWKVKVKSFSCSRLLATPVIRMLVHLILSQRSLRLSSVIFILFTLFCSSAFKIHCIFQILTSIGHIFRKYLLLSCRLCFHLVNDFFHCKIS